jgi:DNA-binding NarL/FixJ family response regulator
MESLTRIRVVVADDVPEVRDGLARLVSNNAGMELVAVARDGNEAEAVTRALEPDVVVMDLRMPHLDGITAARRITAALPYVGVVMYTAYDDVSLVADARSAGVAAYLTKGTGGRELLATIERCAVERRGLPRTAAEEDALRVVTARA